MIDKDDPRLTAYLFDELNVEEAKEVEAALAESPELQAELEAIRATSDLLASEFANQSGLGIGDTRRSAIVQAIDESGAESNSVEKATSKSASSTGDAGDSVGSRSRSQIGWMLAVAAAIALLSIPLLRDFDRVLNFDTAKAPLDWNTEREPSEDRDPSTGQESLSGEIGFNSKSKKDKRNEEVSSLKSFEMMTLDESSKTTESKTEGDDSLSIGGVRGNLIVDDMLDGVAESNLGAMDAERINEPDRQGRRGENDEKFFRGGRGGGGFGGGGLGGGGDASRPELAGENRRSIPVQVPDFGVQPRRSQRAPIAIGGVPAPAEAPRSRMSRGRDQLSIGGGGGSAGMEGPYGYLPQAMNENTERQPANRPGSPQPAKPALIPPAERLDLPMSKATGNGQQGQQGQQRNGVVSGKNGEQLGQQQAQGAPGQQGQESQEGQKAESSESGQTRRGQEMLAESASSGDGSNSRGAKGELARRLRNLHPVIKDKDNSEALGRTASEIADASKEAEQRFEDSEFRFLKRTSEASIPRTRKEKRKRIVQTDEGPKEEEYSVDVDFLESSKIDTLTMDDTESEKLVQLLTKRIDPSGKREIQLPADPRKGTDGKAAGLGLQFYFEVDKELQKAGRFRQLSELEISRSREAVLRQVRKKLAERNAKIQAKKSWKRVRATPNTSRLMVGDKDELAMNGMQVNVHVEGFRARVLIDCLYYNDRNRQLEGNFKIRLPDDASLYYFAFGQSTYQYRPNTRPTPKDIAANEFEMRPQLVSFAPEEIRRARRDNWASVKESRMVTKEKAAFAYNETIRRRVDPALVEWSGGGIFNARIFPLMPQKMHRIVIGYDVDLRQQGATWSMDLDLPEEKGACQVNLHVADLPGATYQTNPPIDPVESNYLPLSANEQRQVDNLEDRLNQLVGRHGKRHPEVLKLSQQLEALRKKFAEREGDGRIWRTFSITQPEVDSIRLDLKTPPVTVLKSQHDDEQSFFAYRGALPLDSEKSSASDRAIFLLDTSLSSQPDKMNVWLKLMDSTLKNNEDSLKEFAVIFFSVDQHLWQSQYTQNTPANREKLLADCQDLALEGATDLYAAFQRIQVTPWLTSKKNQPNVFLLSDGNANWGESNLRMLTQMVSSSNLESVFAYQTGLTGTAMSSLRFLTSETGGAVFSVVNETEIAAASVAHRARPWRVNSIKVDNGSDVMSAGRLQWVYPEQIVTLAGRVVDNEKPIGKIEIQLAQGGIEKTLVIEPAETIPSEMADRVYGQISVDQMESLGENLVDVSAAYARHFRITGETCSLLMLESEADYRRFNIVPQDDKMVVATREANQLVSKVLAENAADLSSPTAQFRAWVRRLETMEGFQLQLPTSLTLLLDEIELAAITGSLDTTYQISKLDADYLQQLRPNRADYGRVMDEAKRRLMTSSDDAVKAVSSLIETNQGDLVMARDIAFSAMEWKHPAHAFHLLRRVAESRPYEAATYPAIAKCLVEVGELDAAMVFYEIALAAKFNRTGGSFKRIVAFEYSNLLRDIAESELPQGLKNYARIRGQDLAGGYQLKPADLVVTMMWNTDQTDVDLHVLEPSGEECYYQNKKTRSGGQITDDITTGFGPEMYVIPNAPKGKFKIYAKYFRNNSSRTARRGKVYLEIIRNYGKDNQTRETKTVLIDKVGEKNKVLEVDVE